MTWNLQSGLGTFRCGALNGQTNVSSPQLGLHAIRLNAAPLDGQIGRLSRETDPTSSTFEWPAKLADAYIRGDDLVATYQETKDWPFGPQVYWRAETPDSNEVLGAFSILVSVSTHLLDTFPRISATTQLTADEVLHVTSTDDGSVRRHAVTGRHALLHPPTSGAACFLWRLPGGLSSYAEIMPASDFRQVAIHHESTGVCESRWELFSEFLEKGVIRRACLHSAFLPREHDVRLAAEYCRTVSARPLPLTT